MTEQAIYKVFNEKNALQRWFARKMFRPLELVGLHITGDHFYEPIPNTKIVARLYDEAPRRCVGLHLDMAFYEDLVCDILHKTLPDFLKCNLLVELGFRPQNPYYHGFDAVTLFGMIRYLRPKRLIEVGQGMSTRVAMAALNMNWSETGHRASLTTIDPHQRIHGFRCPDGIDVQRLAVPVQDVGLQIIGELQQNDLLFVDSSHVFKFGSDVQYEFEHIYPALNKGVVVHVHDIFTPFDYPKAWIVDRKMFWNEQYYLEQFLSFNNKFSVFLPSHYVTRLSRCTQEAWRKLSGGEGSLAWWTAEPHESASSFYLRKT